MTRQRLNQELSQWQNFFGWAITGSSGSLAIACLFAPTDKASAIFSHLSLARLR